ncbi:hypothetical protein BDF22DRAFT_746373 [Syncephalis plumigaleata]|nr:hypothetical protein BDF22DRAFT_746373 [Syncephalis plumigaleata]
MVSFRSLSFAAIVVLAIISNANAAPMNTSLDAQKQAAGNGVTNPEQQIIKRKPVMFFATNPETGNIQQGVDNRTQHKPASWKANDKEPTNGLRRQTWNT